MLSLFLRRMVVYFFLSRFCGLKSQYLTELEAGEQGLLESKSTVSVMVSEALLP